MDALLSWFAQLELDKLWMLLVQLGSALLCITVHEASHGLAADRMGDPTARRMGRVSLNPLRHIDFVGLAMMAVAGFGWAKPVPVDDRNFHSPKRGMALTALAGPVSNVLLSWLALLIYYLLLFFYNRNESWLLFYITLFFLYTASLSAGLAVFNLVPVPPLDGSKVLFSLIPNAWYDKLMRYERYGMIAVGVLILTGVLDTPLALAQDGLVGLLDPLCSWVYDLMNLFF